MKKYLLIVFGMLTLMFSSIAMAQTKEEVILLFEKKVEKFEKCFSSKPKVLLKESRLDNPKLEIKGSPTGYIIYYGRFDNYKISYDIQTTNSLISPYTGYITLTYSEASSKKCGDFDLWEDYSVKVPYSVKILNKYFTTVELARQKKDDESCYEQYLTDRREAKFIFAYQKKQWVYKDVVHPNDNSPNYRFYNAFGISNPVGLYVEDNDFWKKLIE